MTYIAKFPLPYLELAANRRYTHWAQRSAMTKTYKAECFLLAKSAQVQCLLPKVPYRKAHIIYTFSLEPVVKDGRHRPQDWDNASSSIKALQDALVKASVLIGDDRYCLSGEIRFKELGEPCVQVQILESF